MQNKPIKLKAMGYASIAVVALVLTLAGAGSALAANYWAASGTSCLNSTKPLGGNFTCLSGKICGNSGSSYYCSTTIGTASAPAATTTSSVTYSGVDYSGAALHGGYIIDCFAKDSSTATYGYCDNESNFWCNADSSCTNNHQVTNCTGGSWNAYSCGTCLSGWENCGGTCNVQAGITPYPGFSNTTYASDSPTCTPTCKSGWYDHDLAGVTATNGCELQSGSSCDAGSGPTSGAWSCSAVGSGGNSQTTTGSGNANCTCVATGNISNNDFQAGVNNNVNTTNPLLWGTQLNSTGALISMTSSAGAFNVANNGAVTTSGGLTANAISTTGTGSFGLVNVTNTGTFGNVVATGAATSTFGALTANTAILGGNAYPITTGSSGQFLQTNGSGLLSWHDAVMTLNNQTGTTQTFATAATGTDFTITSANNVHTFNIPDSSAANRGLLTSTDWSNFNSKQTSTANLNSLSGLTYTNPSIVLMTGANTFGLAATDTYYLNSNPAAYLSTVSASGTAPVSVSGSGTVGSPLSISMSAANGSTNGYLTSSDWTTFNGKEPALTAGTTSQYYRGDKSWQTLDTTAVPESGTTNIYFTNARARSAMSATAPVSFDSGTGVISMAAANGSTNGYLTSSDWTTFNGKQNALTFGNLTETGTSSILTINGGTGAVIGSGTSIQVAQASSTTSGFLSNTDWSTFNNKQPAGNYLTPNGVNGSWNNVTVSDGLVTGGSTVAYLTSYTETDPVWTAWHAAHTPLETVAVTAPLQGNGISGTPIYMASASAGIDGYLTGADWSTFNGKMNAASGSAFIPYTGASTSINLNTQTITNAGSFNGLTLATATTGFAIGGGVTPETLTVDASATVSLLNAKADYNFGVNNFSGTGNFVTTTGLVQANTGSFNYLTINGSPVDLSLYVPYTNATKTVNLGAQDLTTTGTGSFGWLNVTNTGTFGYIGVTNSGSFGSIGVTNTGTFGNVVATGANTSTFGVLTANTAAAGQLTIGSTSTYTFPQTDGTTGQALVTGGTGTVSWMTLKESAVFVGYTSGSHTGDTTDYNGADTICRSESVAGSHMCSVSEMLYSISKGVAATSSTGYLWVNGGAVGGGDDCQGHASGSGDSSGEVWDLTGGAPGTSLITNCDGSAPLACCK